MGIEQSIVHTVSAEWKLKGAKPTVAEILKMAEDLKSNGVPRDKVVDFEPPYSDVNEFPARFFIKPYTVEPKQVMTHRDSIGGSGRGSTA